MEEGKGNILGTLTFFFVGSHYLEWKKKYSWQLNSTEWINEITLNEPLLKKKKME